MIALLLLALSQDPGPGVGVFFRAEEVPALRKKVQTSPCKPVYDRLRKEADAALAKWAEDKTKLRIEELAPKLPDLTMENVPAQFAPDGGKALYPVFENYCTHGAPAAAFLYLLTGERKYAAFAWDVFEQAAKTNRWGWFPWSGSHLPQIHFGIIARNLILVADCAWDTLTDDQRRRAKETIAEKVVEPYFRLVLHTPGMGLYHLRSLNQGNNALAAALIGSLFVGDAVADNEIWFASLLQTYHWAITHDIGWMGQHLESGMPGYWSVSMQNLYTAACALRNVRGIELRPHPGFEQATYYPLLLEATVPPTEPRDKPFDPSLAAPIMGHIATKPIELPHHASCGAWWLDYAATYPESPARYFVSQGMAGRDQIRAADAHQGTLAQTLEIAWWDDRVLEPSKPPEALALFTDRMAGLRSGYGYGHTYLYFNGDLFLSAKKEMLGATSGLAWHFPWHQYQIAESGLETEGEPFAPSMVIKEARHTPDFSFFRAESGPSNVTYYRQKGQSESWTHYDRRERSVLYVRGGEKQPDYFVFLDHVRHKDPRWHGWTWHVWDSASNPANYGRVTPIDEHSVRIERPNADLWIYFLAPGKVSFEQHGVPGQPHPMYQMDHNVRMMRALAGGLRPCEAMKVTLPPLAWKDMGVAQEDALYLELPPTDKTIVSTAIPGLVGGLRYRASFRCKREDYRVYEATSWQIDLELLDENGAVLAKPQTPYGHPDPLRLDAPRSDVATHDWVETAKYFDAPEGAVAVRASFRAVGGAHYFKLGKLWLGAITLSPLGTPQRTTEERFLTIVMPLDKGAKPPTIELGSLRHPDGTEDEVGVGTDGSIAVARHTGPTAGPIFQRAGSAPTHTLKTNSDGNAKLLTAGLRPVLEKLAKERDAVGRKNLALGATVTASASRDERFPPSKIVDNETAEYPLDGHLDYTLGEVLSSGRTVGYGQGKESLLSNRDSFPLYVKPTYWLLPEEKLGWIELTLARPATVDLVRLLNTSNAGLNDFATHRFRVELYDESHRRLAGKDDQFGKVFDRPFKQAFFVPEWYSHYPESFAGMLEPGLTVPFGDGWKPVPFDGVKGVKSVRVAITKYWGIGGGLNEVQIYGQE